MATNAQRRRAERDARRKTATHNHPTRINYYPLPGPEQGTGREPGGWQRRTPLPDGSGEVKRTVESLEDLETLVKAEADAP